MKVLVTGASGFIGAHTVTALLNTGHEVIASGRSPEKAACFDWFDKVTFIPCDIRKQDQNLYELFKRPDKCIHLSWEGLPNYKSLHHIEDNLPLTYNFLKNLVSNGLPELLVSGTCFEYGMQNGCIKDNSHCEPNTAYSIAKDSLHKMLICLKETRSFNLKWVRLFYLYGKGQNSKSLLAQLETAIKNDDKTFKMSGGEQLRDYLPASTAADYIVRILMNKDFEGSINCCSGSPISIRKLVENYIKDNNSDISLELGYYPYPVYEPMAFWGDTTLLKSVI